ncbi:hypothetical protein OIDMADRAFT_52910 [Oidiodendron maius Zn]|uniref:Uncharacterized protein n=1 Tax=Oidiodendron maius (strain Zn) TaxID=913774 RepID=A0A0C3DM68_OIDMZ|nr:hypothetical protein OIDMADRAFT_52910 [Oidiodendron maius Zn]
MSSALSDSGSGSGNGDKLGAGAWLPWAGGSGTSPRPYRAEDEGSNNAPRASVSDSPESIASVQPPLIQDTKGKYSTSPHTLPVSE